MSIGGAIGGMLFTVSGIRGRADSELVFSDTNALSQSSRLVAKSWLIFLFIKKAKAKNLAMIS
jgi:hypothetical protein